MERIRSIFLQNSSKGWYSSMMQVIINWWDLSLKTIGSGHLNAIFNIQFIDRLSIAELLTKFSFQPNITQWNFPCISYLYRNTLKKHFHSILKIKELFPSMLMITSGFENVLLVLDLAYKKLHVFKQFVTLTWLNFLRSNYATIVLSDQIYCLIFFVFSDQIYCLIF